MLIKFLNLNYQINDINEPVSSPSYKKIDKINPACQRSSYCYNPCVTISKYDTHRNPFKKENKKIKVIFTRQNENKI